MMFRLFALILLIFTLSEISDAQNERRDPTSDLGNISRSTVLETAITSKASFYNPLRSEEGDSEYTFSPNILGAWVEVLVLPIPVFPCFGTGIDISLINVRLPDSEPDKSYNSVLMRFWYGGLFDESLMSNMKSHRFWVDHDLLLGWSCTFNKRFSLRFFCGYGYREFKDKEWNEYSGSRFKYGIELNDVLIDPFLSVRLRLMAASFGNTFRSIEPGPIAIGFSVGWFNNP